MKNRHEIKDIIGNFVDISSQSIVIEGGIEAVKMFKQTWPSTALGFGGWGGSAMTTAWTTVVRTSLPTGDKKWYIFFNGIAAYAVVNPTEEFLKDLKEESIVDKETAMTRY